MEFYEKSGMPAAKDGTIPFVRWVIRPSRGPRRQSRRPAGGVDAAPELADDPNRRAQTMSLDELIEAGEAAPGGVTARSHTSMPPPPQVPDIMGVRERRFLDHTGLVRHQSIGELMRRYTLVRGLFGACSGRHRSGAL